MNKGLLEEPTPFTALWYQIRLFSCPSWHSRHLYAQKTETYLQARGYIAHIKQRGEDDEPGVGEPISIHRGAGKWNVASPG